MDSLHFMYYCYSLLSLVCHRLQWTTNLKNLFVSAMNMLIIYLFASMKLEKGHKKNYLALVLKLCYTMIFYEIG